MKRIIVLMILSLLVVSVQAAQINSNWVGSESGRWNVASNWDPAIVPDNDDDTFNVIIDGGIGDKKQVFLMESRTIDQLDCYGNVWIESRTPYNIELTIEPNGLTNHGNLRIRGGAYNERAEFTIYGEVTNESGGALELFGVRFENGYFNASNATTGIKYENTFGDSVQNEGVIMVNPLGEMSVGLDGILSNSSKIFIMGTCGGGTVINDVNGKIEGMGLLFSNDVLINNGRLYAFGGSLVVACGGSVTNGGFLGNNPSASLNIMHMDQPVDVNNIGSIEVNTGGGVAFDCNLINEPNAIIQLNGGNLSAATTITQSAGATFKGFGGITGNVIIEEDGIIKLTGPTNVVGDITIGTNATLEISDGTTLVTGHTINNGTIHMKGGRIIPQGGITNNGNVIWEPGTYNNIADFNLDGKVSIEDFADFAETWLWEAGL